jgi:general secretion pathway protein E
VPGRTCYEWRLATVGDVTAYLAAREKDVHALDTVAFEELEHRAAESSALALSLQGISNDDSSVVRLLNSTIYDALKMQPAISIWNAALTAW